jgi:hypothetical protein
MNKGMVGVFNEGRGMSGFAKAGKIAALCLSSRIYSYAAVTIRTVKGLGGEIARARENNDLSKSRT